MEHRIDLSQYKEVRKLHSNILSDMVKYFDEGNFEIKALVDSNNNSDNKSNKIKKQVYDWDFNMHSPQEARVFYDVMMYKTRNDMSCITGEFIEKNMYTNKAKTNMLKCMLDAKIGLFDVLEVCQDNSTAIIEDVFTKEKYTILDTGISNNPEFDKAYIYMRIMTYKNITFNTGVALIFLKENESIIEFIEKNKEVYDTTNELVRYFELYKLFFKGENDKKVRVVTNQF